MNYHKKIANANHEECAASSTRSFSSHGLSKGYRREKKIRNRVAKRIDKVNSLRLSIEEN